MQAPGKPQAVIAGFGGGSAMTRRKRLSGFSQQSDQHRNRGDPDHQRHRFEVTSACVISDPDVLHQHPLFNNALYPDMAILDPELVVSVPPQITANTGMGRALTHAPRSAGFHRTPARLYRRWRKAPPNWCSSIRPRRWKRRLRSDARKYTPNARRDGIQPRTVLTTR